MAKNICSICERDSDVLSHKIYQIHTDAISQNIKDILTLPKAGSVLVSGHICPRCFMFLEEDEIAGKILKGAARRVKKYEAWKEANRLEAERGKAIVEVVEAVKKWYVWAKVSGNENFCPACGVNMSLGNMHTKDCFVPALRILGEDWNK